MYVQVKNENYGYSNATFGDFVAVGNPSLVRYNPVSSSLNWSGSVDVFIYNKNLDQHDLVGTLYKLNNLPEVLLAAETGSPTPPPISGSLALDPISSEPLGSDLVTSDKNFKINNGVYSHMAEDGYGLSLDIYNKVLAVGCPYYLQHLEYNNHSYQFTGSSVDLFNLTSYQQNNLNTSTASLFDQLYINSINNPDNPLTGSFGLAVSLNDGWLAIGSPYVTGSEGMVYIYKLDMTGSQYSWSFQQKITSEDTTAGLLFGSCLELNKATGSRSGSLIVGVGNISASRAYLFEFTNSRWVKTYTFTPSTPPCTLTFGGYNPYNMNYTTSSGYGMSVSLYDYTVVIGAPRDRTTQEYSSSSTYAQGALYIYDYCRDTDPIIYNLSLKTYGNENILKNNKLGQSVGIYGNNIVAGCPKVDNLSSCYVEATLGQLHYCAPELENILNGQILFIQRNTSSNDWEIGNIFQKKKKFLSPYRQFGYNVDIADRSLVVGAPMVLSDLGRQINLSVTQSLEGTMEDISGKAYIYNINNYRPEFHVGNVFYRNGKIVLMTSGSTFDGLLFNPVSPYTYEYELDFKGKHTIYENQIICTVNPGEFNVSTNPTAITKDVPILDINNNGYVDFQDVDVLLSYMQYKNTQLVTNGIITTNWSSSIVTTDEEKSLLAYYQTEYDTSHTSILISESIHRFDFVDTWMQNELDFNQDNKIDTNDINILWKYFSVRLTQQNYSSYINPACNRKLFSDIIDHMDQVTKKNSLPLIKSEFFDYERLSSSDKTGSFLAPMATTIGLYSGLDLVAIAKLGSPIKISPELPINFVVKMDF